MATGLDRGRDLAAPGRGTNDGECPHYVAGEAMGKSRPICAYYIASPPDASGGCKRHDEFMCVAWLAAVRRRATRTDT